MTKNIYTDSYHRTLYDSYCYKWTRNTGHYYIGIRCGNAEKHGVDYIGSGVKFLNMFNNTSREEWTHEILGIGTWEYVNILEETYVASDKLTDPLILNLREGGQQGKLSEKTKKLISEKIKEKYTDEEYRRKISESHIGFRHSDETKKKFSEINSGENHNMYGKTHSEESKKKMSKSRKGKYRGKQNPFYGRKHSEESKEKISRSKKGVKLGPSSEESKQKKSLAMIGEKNPMYGKAPWNKGKKLSPESIRKRQETRKRNQLETQKKINQS